MRSGSVVRRLQLGRALRELREAAGFSLEVAAPRLDWSSSKLSRIEKGQQVVDVHGVRSMLDLYDGADRWDELLELTRQTRQRGWWRAHGVDDRGYVPLETEASSVREFTMTIVPGLLQTADYTRAVLRALPGKEDPELGVAVRAIRQQRLTAVDGGLELAAIMEEGVLHRPVGGPAVMRAQLAHLVEAASWDSVTFQVLPTGVGAHCAMSAGFAILSFGGLHVGDMAYVEHPMGAVHIEKAADVASGILRFDKLRSEALSPADSVALVRRVAEQLTTDEDEVHGGPERRPMAQEQLQHQQQ